MEDRRLLAVTATFLQSQGLLTVYGDSLANTIEISRSASGGILVNGGAVAIRRGQPTVANTTRIQVFGLGGNDTIALNEVNGALPRATLYGGAGNDTLRGGTAADALFGEAGNDILFGFGGADLLAGGTQDDVLTGGDGDDQVHGQDGTDRLVWSPGDDSDFNEGGNGTDTIEVQGGNGAEQFTVTANGTRVRFDRLDPAPFSLDIGTSENLVLQMNGGDDSHAATGNLAALIQITVDGGSGNDTILGSNGSDLLIGGDGNDFVDGNQGNDIVQLGAGDDVFQWDPGDGSDTVAGQDGSDRMQFNGSNANEIFDASASSGHLRLNRNVGSIVMDLHEVERVDVETLGGADLVTINDLASTGVVEFNINLASTLGGSSGDGQSDTVVVYGREASDAIEVVGGSGSFTVVGLATTVRATAVEAGDQLVVGAVGGDDSVSAATLPAGTVKLTLDGGEGNDQLVGSPGADVLLGTNGHDVVEGRQGDDVVFLGAGDDLFSWNPGDGNDVIEGQDGSDRLRMSGANVNENVSLVANGGRVLVVRDVGSVTLDLDDTETIEFLARGGSDTLVVGDLVGTDATNVRLDLTSAPGSENADGQADRITVLGTGNADVISVHDTPNGVVVTAGVTVEVAILDGALDELTVDGLAGDDVLDASALPAGIVKLTLRGGLGNDLLKGSQGDDLVLAGDGTDVAFLGGGDDVFVWSPGDDSDTVEGQDGFDKLTFNGSNVGEIIDLSANGSRVRLQRNVATVAMDLNGVESVDIAALGGADVLVINDLSGTDVTEVAFALAVVGGGGDLQADHVIINGSTGDDALAVVGDSSGVVVLGATVAVTVTGTEASLDRLTLNGLAGNDALDASGLAAGALQFVADGGDNDDVVIGSDAADFLFGGAGDDILIGGPDLDVLDGGSGDNILIQ